MEQNAVKTLHQDKKALEQKSRLLLVDRLLANLFRQKA